MTRIGTLASLLLSVSLAVALATPAGAIDFSRDGNGDVKVATDASCPTLTSPPAPFEAWLNTDDFEVRGYLDPKNQTPWSFASRMAQVICGAKTDAKIKIGFFFIRALGTMTAAGLGTRPESDPEVVWDAIEYVHKQRNVSVEIVIDKGSTTGSALDKVKQRLVEPGIASLYLCYNGCFNTNSKSVFPYALNHEKFITISDTTWENDGDTHPVVMQSSGNIARSQIRTYLQEATVFYDDHILHDLVAARADGMVYCAKSNTKCKTSSGVTKPANGTLSLYKSRGIWVDRSVRHYTDSDRGTAIAFSPQPTSTADYYIEQFDNVDCTVDTRIRIAMFKLTDEKSAKMVSALASLQRRGCDVQILMSRSYGSTVFSSAVLKTLKSASIPFKCAAFPMHTKLILIGPKYATDGRILTGTANMSVSGLRYSEEHVITIDTRRAAGTYKEAAKRLYGEYMRQWYELSQGGRSCK